MVLQFHHNHTHDFKQKLVFLKTSLITGKKHTTVSRTIYAATMYSTTRTVQFTRSCIREYRKLWFLSAYSLFRAYSLPAFNPSVLSACSSRLTCIMWSKLRRNCDLYMHYYCYVTVTTYNSGCQMTYCLRYQLCV